MKRCASVAQKGSFEATISIGDNGKAFVAWAMAQCTGSAPSGPVLLKKRRLFRPDDDEDDDDSETEQEQASVEALRAAAEQQDWDTITAWLDDNGAKVFALASWSPTFRRARSPPSQVLPRPRTLLAVRADPAPPIPVCASALLKNESIRGRMLGHGQRF
jgi:hypothetical protein